MSGHRRIGVLALACAVAAIVVVGVLASWRSAPDAACPIGHVVDYGEAPKSNATAVIRREGQRLVPIPGTYLYRSDRLGFEQPPPSPGEPTPMVRISYYVFAPDGTPSYGQWISLNEAERVLDAAYAECTGPSFLRRSLRRDWLLTDHFLRFRAPSNAAIDVTASRSK